jgi:hypothetical protein
MIDKSKFQVNRRDGEFEVRISVEGVKHLTIKAASIEDAKAKAQAMVEDEDNEDLLEIDVITDARVWSVSHLPDMYLINRGGKIMQVSQLKEGDEPREPNETGF